MMLELNKRLNLLLTDLLLKFIHNNFLVTVEKSDIVDSDLEKYFSDVEHGFFHGLMTCFVSYIIINGSSCNKVLEKLFTSCLLHDFLRIDKKYDKHDQQLREYFPLLDDVVYNHSNPNDSQVTHEIIKADRLELRRYKDHLEWLNDTSTVYPQKSHTNSSDKSVYLTNEQIDMIDLFYGNLRPSLEHIFINRNKTSFTHAGEEIIAIENIHLFSECYEDFKKRMGTLIHI